MKVVKIIKNIILGILAVVFYCFVIAMTILLLNFNEYGVTQFGNTTLIIIKDDIASKNFQKGDYVAVEGKKLENIKVGEEIFVYKVDKNGNVSIDLGTVGEVYLEERAFSYENGATYSEKRMIGKSSKVYNGLGNYLSVIQSKWGFMFIVLVPSFLIFVYLIYALIIEIKYGKNEE